MLQLTTFELFLRLFLAVFLGGLVGFEREREHMAAGLRTHILVCLGSTLAIVVSVNYFGYNDASTRIAQGLITGIGFLGAGTIIHASRQVKGLTTAASVWMVCIIGVAIGFGYYLAALTTTIFVTLLLFMKDDMFFKEKPKAHR